MTGIWGTRVANELHAQRRRDPRRRHRVRRGGLQFVESRATPSRFLPSQLIQIDIDPQEVGKIYPVDARPGRRCEGDAARAARRRCAPRGRSRSRRAPPTLKTQKDAWQSELAIEQHNAGKPIHPARLLNEISRIAPKDTIFVTDVGWNKNGAGQQLVTAEPAVVHHERRIGDHGLRASRRRSAQRSRRRTGR